MRRFATLAIILVAATLVGCEYWVEIPAGHIGKVLTPKGWDKRIYEAGSFDIKEPVGNEPASRMVLLEVTSATVKEAFAAGKEDHRIIIGKVPIAVDVYIRAIVPEDEQIRNDIYVQVTPAETGKKRVQTITVQKIYNQFAAMDVRSGIRAIFNKYKSFEDINLNLEEANQKLGVMVVENFKKSGVPLVVQNVQISNVKPDQTVWEAENRNAAALAQVNVIKQIGAEIKKNPGYLQFKKWETLEKMNKDGVSITIIDGQPGGIVVGR